MLQLGEAAGGVYLACGVTDLRHGFNGLAQLVAHELGGEPHSGANGLNNSSVWVILRNRLRRESAGA